MMEVRLKRHWGGRLPNSTASVSVARAKYLVEELGIASYLPGQEPPKGGAAGKKKKAAGQKTKDEEKQETPSEE